MCWYPFQPRDPSCPLHLFTFSASLFVCGENTFCLRNLRRQQNFGYSCPVHLRSLKSCTWHDCVFTPFSLEPSLAPCPDNNYSTLWRLHVLDSLNLLTNPLSGVTSTVLPSIQASFKRSSALMYWCPVSLLKGYSCPAWHLHLREDKFHNICFWWKRWMRSLLTCIYHYFAHVCRGYQTQIQWIKPSHISILLLAFVTMHTGTFRLKSPVTAYKYSDFVFLQLLYFHIDFESWFL